MTFVFIRSALRSLSPFRDETRECKLRADELCNQNKHGTVVDLSERSPIMLEIYYFNHHVTINHGAQAEKGKLTSFNQTLPVAAV